MNNAQLKQALIDIRNSLDGADSVDEETLELARELELDIYKILETSRQPNDIETSMDLAVALEAKFESEHPAAANVVREVINTLHKIGI